MAKKTNLLGVRAKRGTNMKAGKAWRLVSPGEKVFKATLVRKMKVGAETVALSRVVK